MTTPKRKVGRPRKVVEEVNSDCEPASKGYVKCLLRKTRDHTHRGFPLYTIMFSGAIFAIGVGTFNWTIVAMGLLGLVIGFDIDNIKGIDESGVPKQLCPHCEPERPKCK